MDTRVSLAFEANRTRKLLTPGLVDPPTLLVHCPLDRRSPAGNHKQDVGNLGDLEQLPTEVQQETLRHMDVASLLTFRRVSSRTI
jgi:hypothetical protein